MTNLAGKNVAQGIGNGIAVGAASGGIFGLGKGLLNNQNSFKTAYPKYESVNKRLMSSAPLSNVTSRNGTNSIPELMTDSSIINNNLPKVNSSDTNITLTGYISNVPEQKSKFWGFINPLTGSNHIYTREEIGAMSADEFAKNKSEIMAQLKTNIGVPQETEMQQAVVNSNSGVVYVQPYTRSDGTNVKGYYRSK